MTVDWLARPVCKPSPLHSLHSPPMPPMLLAASGLIKQMNRIIKELTPSNQSLLRCCLARFLVGWGRRVGPLGLIVAGHWTC